MILKDFKSYCKQEAVKRGFNNVGQEVRSNFYKHAKDVWTRWKKFDYDTIKTIESYGIKDDKTDISTKQHEMLFGLVFGLTLQEAKK